MIVTSVCSRREWTHSTVLYGSTTAVATCGHDQTVKLSLDFLPASLIDLLIGCPLSGQE